MMRCCKYCGALLEDDAQICDFCGAALEVPQLEPAPEYVPAAETPPPEVTEELTEAAPKKKHFKKARLFMIGGIVLAVIAVIVAVNLLFFNPHIAVNKYVAVMNGEFENLEDLAPREYWELQAKNKETTVDQFISDRIESLEANYSQNTTEDSTLGKELSTEVKVLYTYHVSEMHFAGIKEAIESKYGIDSSRVKSAYKLHLKITRKFTKDSIDYAGLTTAVQIDSQWYLIRYSTDPDRYYVNFLANASIGSLVSYLYY